MKDIPDNGVLSVSLNVKSPKTYEEQATIIRLKGFLVDLDECTDFLKTVNYYRLSAYFLPFKKKDGTQISNLKKLEEYMNLIVICEDCCFNALKI